MQLSPLTKRSHQIRHAGPMGKDTGYCVMQGGRLWGQHTPHAPIDYVMTTGTRSRGKPGSTENHAMRPVVRGSNPDGKDMVIADGPGSKDKENPGKMRTPAPRWCPTGLTRT
jgi:hypothetical protein